jgi:hypothetical protein
MLKDDTSVGDVLAALDGQTAALDRANGRTGDLINLMEACDRRTTEARISVSPKPWWKRMIGWGT